MKLESLLTLPSLALQTSAKALRLLAFANEVLAARFAVPSEPPQTERAAPAPRPLPVPAAPAPVRVAPAPAVAAATDATDIPALAGEPTPAVLKALDGLSLTALDELYAYESKHRRRSTVLAGIEAALAPPPAAADEDALLDDVRVPDELVYTTSTPGA